MSYISSDGTNMIIVNSAPSASINLQTSNASNIISTRVDVNESQTEIKNKLKTSVGTIGPTTSLTYTSDMIGYTIPNVVGIRADFTVASGSSNIYCIQGTGDAGMTLSSGVWMVTASSTMCPANNVSGTIYFSTTGLSTSRTAYVGGTSSRTICGTSQIPASGTYPSNSARITGSFITTMVVTSSTEYFQLVNATYLTFSSLTCFSTSCFMNATRIA
jgi:hypothetical protein